MENGEGTRRHETRRRAQEGAVAKAWTPRKTHKVRARARAGGDGTGTVPEAHPGASQGWTRQARAQACEEEAGNARTREAMPREHGCPAPQGAQVSVTRLFPTLLGHTV